MTDEKRQAIRQRYRAYLNTYTKTADCVTGQRFGEHEQECLERIDSKLSLRYDYHTEQWGVYYDHRGLITCIRVIKQDEPFGKVLRDISRNGSTTKQDLIVRHQIREEAQAQKALSVIQEASEEFAGTLDKASRNKVTMSF